MDDRMQDIGDAKPRMSKRRRFIVVGRWALAAAWAAVVYFGPAVSAPSAVAYFVEFAVLGFLLANALWQHMGLLTACAAAVLITCMLGIADGAVSLMVPDHPFSFFDWLVGAGGALAGGIVHEFNNLLTPILGYSEFIRERMGPESEYYDDMSEIYEAGTRAKEIVEQLLPFSRRETDSTAYGPVNLEAVLQDDTKMVSMILPSNIRLEKGYKDIHATVYGLSLIHISEPTRRS